MLSSNNLALVASTNERQISLYDLFDEYLNCLKENSKRTIKYYIEDFKRTVSNKLLSQVDVNDIQKYINTKVAQNLKDSSIYRYYRMLRTVFNYAISHNYIKENPCDGIKLAFSLGDIRNIDYSKRYIRKLKKLFKKTKLYFFVVLDLHTRYAKSRITKSKKV